MQSNQGNISLTFFSRISRTYTRLLATKLVTKAGMEPLRSKSEIVRTLHCLGLTF